MSSPKKLVEVLFDRPVLAIAAVPIKLKEVNGVIGKTYALRNDDTPFHIDQHPHLPAHLQILVCVKQASDSGGESLFLDTWPLLDNLKKEKSDLYKKFLTSPRITMFQKMPWCAPIFSFRAGNFLCVHSPNVQKGDENGRAFQDLIDASPAIRFKMEPGELVVNNNHRLLHARTAFTDPSRHLIRILAWFVEPILPPREHVERAAKIARSTESLAEDLPLWMRKRLGLSGKLADLKSYTEADILAYYRDGFSEDPEKVDALIEAYKTITDE